MVGISSLFLSLCVSQERFFFVCLLSFYLFSVLDLLPLPLPVSIPRLKIKGMGLEGVFVAVFSANVLKFITKYDFDRLFVVTISNHYTKTPSYLWFMNFFLGWQ